jgi:hypothetical protein
MSTNCRKCTVAIRAKKGENFLTPVSDHAPSCPFHIGYEDKPSFSFFNGSCIECIRAERYARDYASGNIYCPGAPRPHTCGL